MWIAGLIAENSSRGVSSTGTFTQSTFFTLNQTDPRQLWTADLDRDGRKDIIIANWLGGGRISLSWHRNTGFGWGSASLLKNTIRGKSEYVNNVVFTGATLMRSIVGTQIIAAAGAAAIGLGGAPQILVFVVALGLSLDFLDETAHSLFHERDDAPIFTGATTRDRKSVV